MVRIISFEDDCAQVDWADAVDEGIAIGLKVAMENRNREIEKIDVRIPCGYGVATDYTIKNECPKCGRELIKKGVHNGCYDGEFTYVDKLICENDCFFYYSELREHNGIKD